MNDEVRRYVSSPCTCGRRRGGTRTGPRSATCSWPITCGTAPPSGRRLQVIYKLRPRRIRRTGKRCSAWSPRSHRYLDPGKALGRLSGGPGVHRVPAARRHLGARRAVGRLEIGAAMRRLLKGRRLDDSGPSGCCSPWSRTGRLRPVLKLAAARWASEDVLIDGTAVHDQMTRATGDGLAAADQGCPGERGLPPGREPG